MTVVLTGTDLTLDEVVRVARAGARVELAPAAVEKMRASRAVVEQALQSGQQVYGFSTGVGMRKRFAIEEASTFCPLGRLALSPQCGFATSVLGNDLTVEDERAKLETIAKTASLVWG